MSPEDMLMLKDREHSEKRVVDLLREWPELAQHAGDSLLHSLMQHWAECDCPFHEFMYHAAWLGCQRVGELNEERYDLEDHEQEGDQDHEQVPA